MECQNYLLYLSVIYYKIMDLLCFLKIIKISSVMYFKFFVDYFDPIKSLFTTFRASVLQVPFILELKISLLGVFYS